MRVSRLVAAVVLTITLALSVVGIVACVSHLNDRRAVAADVVPTVYGPTVNGVRYCGYRYDPYEINYFGYTCTPYLYPSAPPVPSFADYVIAQAMWEFLVGNDGWINGPSYYDRVLLPTSRHTTTIIVSRKAYTDNGTNFNTRWRSEHNRYVKKYPPTFRAAGDTSAKPKLFKGDQFASKANKAADVTQEQTAKRNQGGNAGTVTDPAKNNKTKTGGGQVKVDTKVKTGTKSTGGNWGSDSSRSTKSGSSGFGSSNRSGGFGSSSSGYRGR
jgi:hypothetical protein